MIIKNLSTLKIHRLTQKQYDNAVKTGNIDENALYLPHFDMPTIEVSKIDGVTTLTFTNVNSSEEDTKTVEIFDGKTPTKGIDYFTSDEVDEMVETVLDAVPRGTGAHTVQKGNVYTMTLTLDDGTTSVNEITVEDGLPKSIRVDGVLFPLTWEFEEKLFDGILFDGGSKISWLNSGGAEVSATVLSGSAANATMYGDYFYTKEMVDLTAFSKLNWNFTATKDNNTIAISKTISTLATDFATSKIITTTGVAELDISSYDGEYYILVLSGTPMTGSTSTFTVDRVWLE